MQLGLSLSVLLTTLLFALSAESVPTPRPPITLSLKRVHQSRSDVHPQIFLQQHINRSERRLARMTGRAEPSTSERRAKLHRRVLAIEGPTYVKREKGVHRNQARYNRLGVPPRPSASTKSASVNANKEQSNSTGSPSSLNDDKVSSVVGSPTSDPVASSSAGSNPGFSEAQLQALNSGGLTPANQPTDQNSLGLDDEANDVGYIATVQMGTPPRDFKLLMDSGSADLWVGSENCTSETGGGCGNHNFLGSQSSSTFQDSGSPFNVTYGSGAVAGTIIQDNLAIAGLQLNGHTFGTADLESSDFSSSSTPFDGLMGLAQSTLSEQGVPTPIEALATSGLVPAPITSFKLSRIADQKNDGEVTFGALDSSKFNAATLTTFKNVNTLGFWEGAMDSVAVNGADLGLNGRTAILDTGTTLIMAPADDATAVHNQIEGAKSDGQGGFTVPCTTTAQVALSFGGTQFTIDPRDLAFAPVDVNDPQGDCTSGIASGNVGGATEWLVGDVFLKNAYFSTNVQTNEISLAEFS